MEMCDVPDHPGSDKTRPHKVLVLGSREMGQPCRPWSVRDDGHYGPRAAAAGAYVRSQSYEVVEGLTVNTLLHLSDDDRPRCGASFLWAVDNLVP